MVGHNTDGDCAAMGCRILVLIEKHKFFSSIPAALTCNGEGTKNIKYHEKNWGCYIVAVRKVALPKMYSTFSEAGTRSVSPCLTRMPLMFASPQRHIGFSNMLQRYKKNSTYASFFYTYMLFF